MKDEAVTGTTVETELQGEPETTADDGADIVDGVEVESVPGTPDMTPPVKGSDEQEPPQPVGDALRWKCMDATAIAYEIKGRGVIVRSWGCMVYVPATKLVRDVNNGWRIVAA
jgi:hypothetical protein